MNTCAELEEGLQEIYAEIMLYAPYEDADMFLGYFDVIKQTVQHGLDHVKAGKPIPQDFFGHLQFAIDDGLDSHMTSARYAEKANWTKSDRMLQWVMEKKLVPLVKKLVEACKPGTNEPVSEVNAMAWLVRQQNKGRRSTRRNRRTRKH